MDPNLIMSYQNNIIGCDGAIDVLLIWEWLKELKWGPSP